jgi:hypothetical protein
MKGLRGGQQRHYSVHEAPRRTTLSMDAFRKAPKFYSSPESSKSTQPTATKDRSRSWEGDQVRVQLADLLPALLQAAVDQSAWLDDFNDEIVVISKDLHQVLATFQSMRKQQAA